jgi:hypothetical protein
MAKDPALRPAAHEVPALLATVPETSTLVQAPAPVPTADTVAQAPVAVRRHRPSRSLLSIAALAAVATVAIYAVLPGDSSGTGKPSSAKPGTSPGSRLYEVTTFGDGFHTFPKPTADAAPVKLLPKGVYKVRCRVWNSVPVTVDGKYNHYWLSLPSPGQSDVYFSAFYLQKYGNDIAKDDTGAEIPDC